MSDHAIYAIVHTDTKRLYIGSAVDYRRRWYEHQSKLRRSIHHNRKLQNAWNKYGEEAFEFQIVHTVEFDHELIGWEQFWIDKLKPHYNICLVAGSSLGTRQSEESKAKSSEGIKAAWARGAFAHLVSQGRPGPRSDEERAATAARLSKTWILYSPGGEQVTVTNLFRFCKENGLSAGILSQMFSGNGQRYHHHHGWRVRPMTEEEIAEAKRGQEPEGGWIDDPGEGYFKSFSFIEPGGKPRVVRNLMKFCRDNNLSFSSMDKVQAGKRDTYRGWRLNKENNA